MPGAGAEALIRASKRRLGWQFGGYERTIYSPAINRHWNAPSGRWHGSIAAAKRSYISAWAAQPGPTRKWSAPRPKRGAGAATGTVSPDAVKARARLFQLVSGEGIEESLHLFIGLGGVGSGVWTISSRSNSRYRLRRRWTATRTATSVTFNSQRVPA